MQLCIEREGSLNQARNRGIKKRWQNENRLLEYLKRNKIFKKDFDEHGKITQCKHESCSVTEKVWLPYDFEGRSRG